MHIQAFRFLLAAVGTALLLSAGCGADSAKDRAVEAAGDGSRAYLKIATAYCDRAFECIADAHGINEWSSVEACAESAASKLSILRNVDCSEASDFRADKKQLARCLEAVSGQACTDLYDLYTLIEAARFGLLPECLEVAEQLARAEDERYRKPVKVGEACGGVRPCEWDAYCSATSDSCGVCRRYPMDGERCVIDSEGYPACNLGSICTTEGMCVSHSPKAGEACGEEFGQCAQGLDCNDEGTCAKLHEPGDACSNTEDGGCGDWLACVSNRCTKLESRVQRLGEPCSSDEWCVVGLCVKGTCQAPSDLGGVCSEESDCLNPYACDKGKCVSAPACQTAKPGALCTSSGQCQAGYACFYDEAGSRCQKVEGNIDEPCGAGDACREGHCVQGVCRPVPGGGACDSYDDCESRVCVDGVCTKAASCG
jgi:hypothetical protein